MFRAHWWAAVATVARLVGDLEVAEDAVQDACAARAYQTALDLAPAAPEREFIGRRIRELAG